VVYLPEVELLAGMLLPVVYLLVVYLPEVYLLAGMLLPEVLA